MGQTGCQYSEGEGAMLAAESYYTPRTTRAALNRLFGAPGGPSTAPRPRTNPSFPQVPGGLCPNLSFPPGVALCRSPC